MNDSLVRNALLVVAGAALGYALWRVMQGEPLAIDPGIFVPLDPAPGETVAEWNGALDVPEGAGLDAFGDEVNAAKNIAAFSMVVRTAEGTPDANGYRRMFGGRLFSSYADHPRLKQTATFGNGLTKTSDAAGAYQIISPTWDTVVQPRARLPDFSPASQEAAFITLLQYRGALADVEAGRFEVAIRKCALEWASLPGSPYGQPTKSLATLQSIYAANGGVYA